MEKITCEYCGIVTDKSNKARHQRTKICINNRINNSIISTTHICKYCNQSFSRGDYLKRHEIMCKSKDMYHELEKLKEQLTMKDVIINILKEDIKSKDKEISNLKLQLKESNNTVITNYNYNNNYISINTFNVNVDYEEVLHRITELTAEHLRDIKKLADFLISGNKHKMVVIDKNTNTMGYFHDNKYVKDTKCRKFIKEVGKVLSPSLNELFYSSYKKADSKTAKDMYANKTTLFTFANSWYIRNNEKVLISHIIENVSNKVIITCRNDNV